MLIDSGIKYKIINYCGRNNGTDGNSNLTLIFEREISHLIALVDTWFFDCRFCLFGFFRNTITIFFSFVDFCAMQSRFYLYFRFVDFLQYNHNFFRFVDFCSKQSRFFRFECFCAIQSRFSCFISDLPAPVPPLTPGTTKKMTDALRASFASWEKERTRHGVTKGRH